MSASDEAVAAAQAALMVRRAELAAARKAGATTEERRPDPFGGGVSEAMASILSKLRPMTEREEGYDVLVRGFGAVGSSVLTMLERCAARGIDPRGDICAALLAWDGGAPWRLTQEALARNPVLLLLAGNKGTGKSSTGGRILVEHRVTAGGPTPYFVSAKRLGVALATPYDPTRAALKERCERAPVIVIDDFLRTAMAEDHLRALQEFVAQRATVRKLTIATTNIEPTAFVRAFIDERLADRLRGRFATVHFTGASRRGAVAA